LDLTPRPDTPAARRRRKKNWPAVALLAIALIGVAVVLFEGLSNATSYYCNADVVGVKSGCSGTKRFRLQGEVVEGSVHAATVAGGEVVDFSVAFNGKTIAVHHRGAPQELFKECIGVVLEGSLVDGTFQSDTMLVKHSEQYSKANPSRLKPDTACAVTAAK
jgi:cytochrome c-type biogenesis protein CcmE